MDQPRTPSQTLRDIAFINNHYQELPTQTTISSRGIGRHSPSTNTAEKLPFGLGQILDGQGEGADTIKTPAGALQWARETASWLHTSGFGSAIDMKNPLGWLLTVLDSPYPWEDWDQWNELTGEVQDVAKHIRNLTGYGSQNVGLCPACGNSVWVRMGEYGAEVTAWCHTCTTEWKAEDLVIQRILALRQCQDDVWITAKKAIEIWKPHLDHKTIHNWTRHGRLKKRGDKPAEYPLSQINTLTTQLVDLRKRMSA